VLEFDVPFEVPKLVLTSTEAPKVKTQLTWKPIFVSMLTESLEEKFDESPMLVPIVDELPKLLELAFPGGA